MTFTGKEHITSPNNVCVGDFKVFKCINFASIEFYNLENYENAIHVHTYFM